MLKKTLTYKDFDGNTRTEDFYFNLTKTELIELQVSEKEGFMEMIEQIIAEEDKKKLIEHFKALILLSYGERSEDGRRFIKSKELSDAFSQTAAYDTLFMEMCTSEAVVAEFTNGVMPDVSDIQAANDAAKANFKMPEQPVQQVSAGNVDLSSMSKDDLLKMLEQRQGDGQSFLK